MLTALVDEAVASPEGRLTSSEKAYLSLSRVCRHGCRTMSYMFGITKLYKLMGGSISLDEPAYLLALRYPEKSESDLPAPDSEAEDADLTKVPTESEQAELAEAHEQMMTDFAAKLWFTYRSRFLPLGVDKLTSDVGWGCTLRSCQMMLAQALSIHFLGRLTHICDMSRPALTHIVSMFHDSPDPRHPFSVHSICEAGIIYGLVPGKWMGPYAICRAFQDLGVAHTNSFMKVVTLDSGGGVPCLDPEKLAEHFERHSGDHSDLYCEGRRPAETGLLLLLPVVLGVDRFNEVYTKQLQAVLRMPQSVGVVGGRPGHSCYFIGFQERKLLGMDPHEMQITPDTPGLETHSSETISVAPMISIDSTMALGLYCHDRADLASLCSQMEALCKRNRAAPLLCVGSIVPELENRYSGATLNLSDDNLGTGDDHDSPTADSRSGQRLHSSTSGPEDDWEVVG